MPKKLKIVLLPFAWCYRLGVWVHNRLYDRKIWRSTAFDFPVICVGNLSIGGTGKTPMTEYLIRILKRNYKVGVLSRGYRRKSRGFILADENARPEQIGDEPMQLHLKFPEVAVAVAEQRITGIPQLLTESPEVKVIILDDAFQHRMIRAGLNILLTSYTNLFTRDRMLPAGTLRDTPGSKARAQIIVVTKCDLNLSPEAAHELEREINPETGQEVYFAGLKYDTPYHLFDKLELPVTTNTKVLLVCAIADTKPLKKELELRAHSFNSMVFPDHHHYRASDILKVKKEFEKLQSINKVILTTEKDAAKFSEFKSLLSGLPIYVWPVRHEFLFDSAEKFEKRISLFVESFDSGSSESV